MELSDAAGLKIPASAGLLAPGRLARAGEGAAGSAPKMLLEPPPGGFSTL